MKHRSRGHQRGGRNRNRRDNNAGQNRNSHDNRDNRDSRTGNRPAAPSVLPSPEILQEYEYACEGTVSRLLEMAETEQDRRNAWESEYLRFHKRSLRLGQFFGFILLLSMIWAVMYLSSIDKDEIAKVLAVSAFSAVAAASLFSEIGRRLSRRPRRNNRN